MNVRQLADKVGVSRSHLYRVVGRSDYKSASPALTAKVADALGLPPDYFIELRQGYLIDRIKSDPAVCNRLYAQLQKQERRRRP